MKPLFTLLLSCLISFSLMGQQDIKELQKERYAKKHQFGITAFEKRMDIHPRNDTRPLTRQFNAIQKATLKSDQAGEQQMDSILWEAYDTNASVWSLSDRELFTYDGNGNMTSSLWFAFDSVEMKLIPEDRREVTYNAQNQATEMVWFEWDKDSSQWVKEIKFELSYDGEGNLTQETLFDWDPDGSQWLVGLRYDKTYDGNGNLIEDLWLFWDDDSSKLVLTYRDEYIYEGGRLTTWNEYYISEGSLELTFVTTYTYDNGNLIEELTQGWDFLANDWGDFSKTVYTYVGDRVATEEVWGYDWPTFMMVLLNLYEYTWDVDGNMIIEVESDWDEAAGAIKSLNSVAGAWQNTWKSEWTFNKNFTIDQLYVPYWYQFDGSELMFAHMPVSELGYINNNGTWDLNYRQTASYSDFGGGGPSGLEDVKEAPVSVYPIPASDIITFSWDEKYPRLNIELYDLTGKRIVSRSIENNETLAVDQLSSGIYLYKLMDNNELIQIGKISLR